MGAGEPGPQSLADARRLGRLAAERGWVVLTGGRPAGVMAAACAGAKEVPGSLTLGILPSAHGGVSPDVDIAVFTGMGDARNAVNVLTSDVVIAWHTGFEGLDTFGGIVRALGRGAPRVRFAALRVPRSDVPSTDDLPGLTDWLDQRWLDADRAVDELLDDSTLTRA